MLPDENALVVTHGNQVIVGSAGDVLSENEHCGVFGKDHRYLSGVEWSLSATDEPRFDVLGQMVAENRLSTTLASAVPGDGRGEQRVWTLTKEYNVAAGSLDVRFHLRNNTADARSAEPTVTLVPDFDHIFEISTFFSPRTPHDRQTSIEAQSDALVFSALGIDDREFEVRATFSGTPTVSVERGEASVKWDATVEPSAVETYSIRIEFPAQSGQTLAVDSSASPSAVGEPDHRIAAAATDTLQALMLPGGVVSAGAPRFLAPFGRDMLIVGYQLLPFDPNVAKHALQYLASHQGRTHDDETLEEPGRIFHEQRRGDLVTADVSLRRPYFGTVDATPLFVALYADTYRTTEDADFRDELYASATAGVNWILDALDSDSLLGYTSQDHPNGLTHLGWKDSSAAIAHPDGTPATGTIRLAEVQGYAYRALTRFAPIAERVGETDLATTCLETAEAISAAFEERFWLANEGCYALAVDDAGPVPSVASNQAHAIWGGLGTDSRVARTVDRLMEPDILSPLGLRTYSMHHSAFDPLSYHRGSVWPHDNSVAAMGFAERGYPEAADRIAESGLTLLSMQHKRGRPDRYGFPELVPGVTQSGAGTGNLRHPDACEPAAWSAGSVFGFLQARSKSEE